MRFNLLSIATACLLASTELTVARPYVLKCTEANGRPIADLTVDLENNMMTFGAAQHYAITTLTDRYITGIASLYNTAPPVGGEVWVLDRVNGNFKRAIVGMFYNDATYPAGPFLKAYTMSGRCVRAMF